MSIKNIHIKHKIYETNDGFAYVCIRCCGITKEKVAKTWKEVTCKNCIQRRYKPRSR